MERLLTTTALLAAFLGAACSGEIDTLEGTDGLEEYGEVEQRVAASDCEPGNVCKIFTNPTAAPQNYPVEVGSNIDFCWEKGFTYANVFDIRPAHPSALLAEWDVQRSAWYVKVAGEYDSIAGKIECVYVPGHPPPPH